MKRVLVTYYSLSGNTERVAKDLAARLGADLQQVREHVDRRGLLGYLKAALDSLHERSAMLGELERSAADYELVLVGTPIWAGKITPAVRTYLKTIRGQARRIAFFTTSGSTDIARVLPAMERLAGAAAAGSAGFTDRELRDPALYDPKRDAFIASLRGIPVASHEPEFQHAHA
jgi:flavodoxin